MNPPARLIRYRGFNLAEIIVNSFKTVFTKSGKYQPELGFELGLQREVRLKILSRVGNFEGFPGGAPVNLDRKHDERCIARLLRVVVFKPLQKAKREVENVDALLFNKAAGLCMDLKQRFLKHIGSSTGLQASIDMPAGWAIIAGAFFEDLVEVELHFLDLFNHRCLGLRQWQKAHCLLIGNKALEDFRR